MIFKNIQQSTWWIWQYMSISFRFFSINMREITFWWALSEVCKNTCYFDHCSVSRYPNRIFTFKPGPKLKPYPNPTSFTRESPEYLLLEQTLYHLLRITVHITRDKMLLKLPHTKTKVTLGDCVCSYAAPNLGNFLPLDIKKASSVVVFSFVEDALVLRSVRTIFCNCVSRK